MHVDTVKAIHTVTRSFIQMMCLLDVNFPNNSIISDEVYRLFPIIFSIFLLSTIKKRDNRLLFFPTQNRLIILLKTAMFEM